MKNPKVIKAKHGTCKKIAMALNCTVQLVSLALNGKVESEKAEQIRKMAMELGGRATI